MGTYVGYIVISIVLLHFGFPRLIVEGVAGMLFGILWGIFWAQLVCILVAYSHFLLSRHVSLSFLKLDETIKSLRLDRLSSSTSSVFLSRLLPVPCIFINLMLGKLNIKNKDYLVGSYLGFLANGLPVVLIGAGLVIPEQLRSTAYITSGIIGLLAFYFLVRKWRNETSQPLEETI